MADLPRRLAARLIDLTIWVIVAVVIGRVLGLLSFDGSGALASLLTGLAIVAYEVWLVGTSGATVGKRALGLAVVNDDGSTADMPGALRRATLLAGLTVLSLVPWLWILSLVAVPLLALAGILMIYADDRQQTPWDKIGRTLVVMR